MNGLRCWKSFFATFFSLLAKSILSRIACLKVMLCCRKTLPSFLSFSEEFSIPWISTRVIRISAKYVLVNFSWNYEQTKSIFLWWSADFFAWFLLNYRSIAFITSDLLCLCTLNGSSMYIFLIWLSIPWSGSAGNFSYQEKLDLLNRNGYNHIIVIVIYVCHAFHNVKGP